MPGREMSKQKSWAFRSCSQVTTPSPGRGEELYLCQMCFYARLYASVSWKGGGGEDLEILKTDFIPTLNS